MPVSFDSPDFLGKHASLNPVRFFFHLQPTADFLLKNKARTQWVLGQGSRSGEAWNEFAWSNAEFDTLLAEANSIADADARRAVAGKIQALVAEEGVTIQPYFQSIYRHHNGNVVGAEMHIAFLPQVYKWGLKA